MRERVLSAAARRGMFLSPEALEIVLSNSDPPAFINNVLSNLANNPMFVTEEDVMGCLSGDAPAFVSPKTIAPRNKTRSDMTVIKGTDVTGESTCEGKITDFAAYFQDRYARLRKIIVNKRAFGGGDMPIENALRMDREIRIVGMVGDVRDTKNGHRIMSLEDDKGGHCKALILNDSPHIRDVIVNDSVVGVIGTPSGQGSKRDMIIVKELIKPDVPETNRWEPSDSTASIAFLSDVHVGSTTFLEKEWKRMMDWLKRNSVEREINYLVLPGDVVDGIGIFPGQEEELSIPDIYGQYARLAEYLKDVPDHILIAVQPGNHDAVRPAEPQPALGKVFTEAFDSNVIMTANPVYLDVEGRKVLSYHGRSIDDWIAGVQQLTYEDPLAVMREMVSGRHMAPSYGQRTALAPEKKDYLVIEEVPDIFVTGHVHGAGQMVHRGIRMINASTWQDQTDYQKRHNFNPSPAIMPVVHLGTGRVTMENFA
ncbi:MAG: DNA-directed DNA polymerase II small subunit [Thermoplasmatales archaeon]|nr:DNA-directed DNA polymerase II small subunit [Thermoplasmatales archaeon]